MCLYYSVLLFILCDIHTKICIYDFYNFFGRHRIKKEVNFFHSRRFLQPSISTIMLNLMPSTFPDQDNEDKRRQTYLESSGGLLLNATSIITGMLEKIYRKLSNFSIQEQVKIQKRI